ncbi:MAG TPA: radical SAM protein [bacterium]|nr:radical SAM protein [bacterium]
MPKHINSSLYTRFAGLRDFLSLKLTGAYPRPINVHVEINNTCNLDCVMCPRDRLTRRLTLMDDDLFRSVVRQLAGMGVPSVSLFLFGDPLCHPRLDEMVAYAAEHGVAPVLNTNAMALTEERGRKLLDAGLKTVIFSVDGVTPEVFAEVRRGGDLERVRANILRFLELAAERRPRPATVVQFAVSNINEHEVDAFRAFWEGKVDRLKFTRVTEYAGIEGLKTYEYKTLERRPCPDTWSKMVILADGTVTTCCLDLNGELGMGDAAATPLRDLWRSPRWRTLRRAHRRLNFAEYPVCDACPMPLLYAANLADRSADELPERS